MTEAVVQLEPLVTAFGGIATTAVTAGAVALVNWAIGEARLHKINIDSALEARADAFAQGLAGAVMAKATTDLGSQSINVGSVQVADAIKFAEANLPAELSALKALGFSSDSLKARIVSWIGKLNPPTAQPEPVSSPQAKAA